MAVNGSHKEGRGPQEILEQKRKYFSSVINGHLACPERMWEKGGKKQQVCLEGRVWPQMYFKLLKSEALVLLPSGKEGFEAFISLPQTSVGRERKLFPFQGVSLLKLLSLSNKLFLSEDRHPRTEKDLCALKLV